MTKTDYILLAIGTVLSLFGAVILLDLVAASGAQPCGSGGSSADCYPWGTEGPAAENWRYQSKTAYLVSGFVTGFLPIVAGASLLPKISGGTQVTGLHRAVVAAAFAVTIILYLA